MRCETQNCSPAPSSPHRSPAESSATRCCAYEVTRDELSKPLSRLTEKIAGYQWDLAEFRELLPELSRAMRPEVAAILGFDDAVGPATATASDSTTEAA